MIAWACVDYRKSTKRAEGRRVWLGWGIQMHRVCGGTILIQDRNLSVSRSMLARTGTEVVHTLPEISLCIGEQRIAKRSLVQNG